MTLGLSFLWQENRNSWGFRNLTCATGNAAAACKSVFSVSPGHVRLLQQPRLLVKVFFFGESWSRAFAL